MNKQGNLFVCSGPSGCGKSTVLGIVFGRLDNLYFSVSATTRPMREGERDGEDYFFYSKAEFERLRDNGGLLEYVEYAGNLYGTPREPIERRLAEGIDVVLDVEVRGKASVCSKMPGAVSVFIAPPDMEELECRLRRRGTETDAKIAARMEIARGEVALMGEYDHVVVNDTAQRAAEEIISIILAERDKQSK